jgi:flagellar motor switch protein FliM
MADEPLTEAEIAVLLGKRAQAGPTAPTAPEQLLALVTRIHDTAARHFGAELSAMLRRTARVRLARVQSLSESDFCARAELPSFLRRFVVQPFNRQWMLEVRPGALFPIIDCLLGGGREKTPIARRPLTEIESRLAARVARAWVASLQAAWQAEVKLEFTPEFEPIKTGRTGDNEVLAIAFDIELAGSQGSMHLAIPLVELGAICNPGYATEKCSEPVGGSCIAAELQRLAIEPAELDSLAIGDIITTEHRADEPVIVTQDGVPRFAAKLGAWQGQKAIEIQRELPECNLADEPPPTGV